MRLVMVAESLQPHDGWSAYSLGLLRGLITLGLRPTVLVERNNVPDAPDGAAAIACLSSPLAGLARPPAIAWNAAQLLRHARSADLVHFMVEPYATAAPAIPLPPYVVTLHGTYAVAPFEQRFWTRWAFSLALRRARDVVCVSRFTRDALLQRVALNNTSVINNGHDVPCGAKDTADDLIVDGRPLVVGVGALKPRKGYRVALRAVARLRESFPNLRYYLVGDDTDRKYVERLRGDIAELGLEHQAVITGSVSDRRLKALYRQADLFLLTPVNVGRSFEGFGIAYLEAGAFGKPVVGSRGCGAEEAVEDGVTGLLAAQNDDADIAERARAILSDPDLAGRLGRAGRARAERQTWAAVARQYVERYEHVLAP